jgi:RNA polymerase sigma-70 factor (ECF subfamily)
MGDTLAIRMQVASFDSREQSPSDETTLVQQFCLGDESAFAALVRIWEHRLLTLAYRVVGNVHDAEEVRQNLLLKVVRSRNQLPEPARFANWLRRCLINEAIDWLRRRRAEPTGNEINLNEAIACRSLSPLQEALAVEQSQRLLHAISQLDPDSRALLSLRFDECLTIRQIAEVLERPPMTVHSQITRAVSQLRQSLASDRQ